MCQVSRYPWWLGSAVFPLCISILVFGADEDEVMNGLFHFYSNSKTLICEVAHKVTKKGSFVVQHGFWECKIGELDRSS
ncbi:hypothetical protein IW261DRAFT_1506748 [Armillaria novae-zelandiae]|uniref:Uncharacterized protein n=1 Tax=Armillaria novae-zelandiae TaxID=153914 RepID=A0AA39U804_9AGAR|nr:hypothetical protein IW261DRAFT_1506748 [Armillaria novae-zelandiae]